MDGSSLKNWRTDVVSNEEEMERLPDDYFSD
jgi:hypothetical protein